MKLLILFAAWAPSEDENSVKWLRWYRDLLIKNFSKADIFVSLSHDAPTSIQNYFLDIENVIGSCIVPIDFHINSDASQFQSCIRECINIFLEYDYVLFLHTKGISYSFGDFQSWRDRIFSHTLDYRFVTEMAGNYDNLLIADRGHLFQGRQAIKMCEDLARRCNLPTTVFCWAATTTIYYISSRILFNLISILPPEYTSQNLIKIGESRFFFEGVFPSLLVTNGARPLFAGGARLNEWLSPAVSFDFDPQHNSALVEREFVRRAHSGAAYKQIPVPYVFCSPDVAKQIEIQFEA